MKPKRLIIQYIVIILLKTNGSRTYSRHTSTHACLVGGDDRVEYRMRFRIILWLLFSQNRATDVQTVAAYLIICKMPLVVIGLFHMGFASGYCIEYQYAPVDKFDVSGFIALQLPVDVLLFVSRKPPGNFVPLPANNLRKEAFSVGSFT